MPPGLPPYNLIVILGPTASGKTRLAVSLARELGGEIISADSRQVFRGMDIGSGKDLHEYGDVPYHLIDILDAGQEFSVFEFQKRFLQTFTQLSKRGITTILCGGSGMYLDAAVRGYRLVEVVPDEDLRLELAGKSDDELGRILCGLRPQQHNRTDLLDRQRTIRAIEIARAEGKSFRHVSHYPDIRPLVIGIHFERQQLRQRIADRLQQRLDHGLIEEVQLLFDGGIPWDRLDYYGLEYRYISSFLRGESSRNDMQQQLNSAINNFAKRQRNWFRNMEARGVAVNWVNGAGDAFGEALEIITAAGFFTPAPGFRERLQNPAQKK